MLPETEIFVSFDTNYNYPEEPGGSSSCRPPFFVFLIITVAPHENGWYCCSLAQIISLATIRNLSSQFGKNIAVQRRAFPF